MIGELVGRDDDIASIRAFFDGAGVRGGALLVTGEAGVGKSAVLDAIGRSESHNGIRVLRAAGAEFEADVSYSALNQLLLPLTEQMQTLSAAHRDALRRALGFKPGPAPDRLLVSNAALLLVRSTAAEVPVLIIVDDLNWLDRASAEVLGFVARRLVGSAVGFLAAYRSGTDGFFQNSGLPELVLPPLGATAAGMLVDRRFPELAPAVRQRLLTEAAGNPLALLELPAALDSGQRAVFTALPAVLPLTERVQAVFASRIATLPPRCRSMMLLGALAGTTDPARLRMAGEGTCDLDDLAPAELDQLVHLGSGRLTFRHPLIGSAVVEMSAHSERRWAHQALARVFADDPERQVWHLGESAPGPDTGIADQLEEAARTLLRRGEAIGAVGALTRAADLSPDPADRGRRLAEAAYIGADAGGELATASRLLDDARRTGSLENHSLPAASATAFLLINSDSDVATAHRLLAGALESGDHGFDARNPALIEAMHTLLLVSWFAGTERDWEIFHALKDRLRPGPPPLLHAIATLFSDPARAGAHDVTEFEAQLAAVDLEGDPSTLVRLGTASVFIDRLPRLRAAEWRVVHLGREGKGPARRYLGALMHMGIDDFLAGRWDEATAFADEGIQVCDNHAYRFFRWYFQYQQALVSAARGETSAARQLTDEMIRWATANGVTGATHFALHPRVLNDIAAGDYEGAYREATRLSPPGQFLPYRPTAMWVALDLVEACLHTGRQDEAAAHAAAMREARLGDLSPRLAMLTHAATALTADPASEAELFETALSVPGAERWPFDHARIRLAYGERLRRRRDTTAAREQLTAARDVLEALGAAPWRDRAASELRATGMTRNRQPAAGGTTPLTPQEREIAELAGAGLTNKQIGERMFLSHRTVGDHLYKIFPKLGITSRAALRDALMSYDEE